MEKYAEQGLLHETFIRQAEATPDEVAVVEETGRQLTFQKLHHVTDILAANLRLKGVKPDTCVGIFMDKSIEYVIAYISILKAGGAYMPLDISYPDALLDSILADSKPVAVLTEEGLQNRLKGQQNVIVMKKGWEESVATENSSADLDIFTPAQQTLDSLAYVVYSSGTTGKPKGIQCPHRGAVFSYYHRHITYPYTEGDREACNVFFVWELLRPLLRGVPLYIIPSHVIYDPPLLCEYLSANQITRMLFTPSLLEAVLNSSDINFEASMKSMRTIIFCGEVVTTSLYEKCMKLLPWIQFLNLYSVSECHDVACEDLNVYFNNNKDALLSRKFCPVGKVIQGVQIVILDADHKCQPVGSSGEIYVGGPTLARGYLNRPEVQALRFVQRPDSVPSSCGDILYRSGDWGYMLSDGSLEICGRCDSMVKIRGYSIETQAVEAALMELPKVHSCVVIVKGAEGEDKFLVTYIVPTETVSKKELRDELKKRLPFYMIPAYFVFLSKIPVVPATGKLDKAALPPYDNDSDDSVINEGRPVTKTEVAVATVWCKILQMREADIVESFFDLGGHSLLATELMNQLSDQFQIKLTVRDLFSYPTIHSLSLWIDSQLNIEGPKPEQTTSSQQDLALEVDKHDQGIINIDMQLRAFWRSIAFYNQSRIEKSCVLLTGSTGFLGSFILRELLLKTKMTVFCLIREMPDMPPLQRLKKTLCQYSLLAADGQTPTDDQILLASLMQKRVIPLKGNVALMNLGLSDEDYTCISSDIDLVIHAAATVNLVYPYSALHGNNVVGTTNVVAFAVNGKIKPIHFISTDSVFPAGMSGCLEEDDTSSYHTQLHDGYSQSKWVAEQLIQRAGQKGIPVTIYRLGNMSGDSQSAIWNPQDFTLILLQACVRVGMAPDVDWLMELTPVNFAAQFIVQMAKVPATSLGKTFHVINDKPLQARWVFEWMNAHGFPLKIVPFEEWRNSVLKSAANNSMLEGLLQSYIIDPGFFSTLSTYRADNLHAALSSLNLTYPYTDTDLLDVYFTNLRQAGVLEPDTTVAALGFASGQKPLKDKVVIVTGASSGIGKAIAESMARAGAKVAMAARRMDRIQEVSKSIADSGGIAIAVKCDVTSRQEVRELVRHTEMTLGPIDILVNNAGTMYYTMMKNVKEEEWDTMIDVNIKGLTNCVGAVLDGMLKREQGHIVNMSSNAGRKGFAGLAVYSGTKFYVEGLSQGMRSELAGSGVKVTCIQPGDVSTELLTHTTDEEARAQYDGSSNTKILEPQDIANAVLYATSQPHYVGVNEILIEPREAPI